MNEPVVSMGASQPASPFQRWVDAARPKVQLWRTILGVVIAIVISQVIILAVGIAYAVYLAIGANDFEETRGALEDFARGKSLVGEFMGLACFGTIWFGVWVALRLLHGKQKFLSLISPENGIRWREFGLGAAIMFVFLLLSTGVGTLMGGSSGYRNDISMGDWLMALAPLALLTFIQSGAEELLFRGYLMQHLAARFSHPLVWGFLPAAAFGAIHFFNGETLEHGIFYALDTTLFGLIAAVTVWRTGSISMAMGIHVLNNLAGFALSGTDDMMSATPLFLDSVENAMKTAWMGLPLMGLLLAYVCSPWAPMPKWRKKETRAAP